MIKAFKAFISKRGINLFKNKTSKPFEGEIFFLLTIAKLITFLLLLYIAKNIKPLNTINPSVIIMEVSLLLMIFSRVILLHKKQSKSFN